MAALTHRVGTCAPVASQKRVAPRVAFKPVAQLNNAAGQAAGASGAAARSGVVSKAAAVEAPAAAAPKARKSEYELYTFNTWLFGEERRGTLDTELATVLSSISVACKQIAAAVGRAGISSLTGVAGTGENVQGEEQKKLDVISNDIFSLCLRNCGRTGVIASEEEENPIGVEETTSGNYIVVFDPLDGSSNIDAGISVGSIFGVYSPAEECIVDMDDPEKTLASCITNVCQPGKNLLAAGYVLYSSCTILVLTIGDGVYGFTLDPYVGEFVLTHDRIQIPEKGKIYAFNEGNYELWDDATRSYIDSLKKPELWDGKPYSARYIGSLVGDFHRTLLYGGIYGYPGDKKNANGKLRLLYECAPMSMIAEQAGGLGSTGTERVMDIVPTKVHQRVPLFVGSPAEVRYLESFTKKAQA
ncbi:fructose-1,6-bisphosphatase [Monoraphidium neglectum]|uniref:fructose-bisphosphatase n=1 Tax=Monoraphidium neglectum TaxID=145388 RepID=A0A0D2KZC3_9CHLO|nr:fructose-1,6-bisphosphatase [Monoraphidium neglectum]KIZ00554.1 fructose-1,6-bisphosphatase [Monoraphidium neglectum]|eukprot:XP_013899573.1 fructose-1,6-bisphosphatase [Monoraphidium neglectum]